MTTPKPRTREKQAAPPQPNNEASGRTEAVESWATDGPRAPLVFFDRAPTLSMRDGIVGFTLTAARHLPAAGEQTKSDAVVVAHLRCSLAAARQLHDLLSKALLLGAKPQGERH